MVNRRWKLFSGGAGLLLLAASLLSVGCSGSSGKTRFRFVNALSGANFGSVDVLVDAVSTFPNVAPNTATAYTALSGGSHNVLVNTSGTSDGLIPTQAVSFSSGDDNTLFAATDSSAVNKLLLFTDNNTAPDTNNFNIRFINASTSYGNVDVYVLAPSVDYHTVTATVSNLSLGAASSYLPKTLGTYDIVVTPTGSKTNEIETGSLSYGTGAVRTFVVLNNQQYLILDDLN